MMALVMIMRKRRRRMRRGMRRITMGVSKSKKGNEGEETESLGKKP